MTTVIPDRKRSRNLIIGACAAGVIVIGVAIWLFSYLRSGEPRLNDNTVVLSKFVSSSGFEKLPYEKKRQYYKVLDDRNNELDQMFRDHRLTESEYRTALEAAWLGKHINRVEKYYSLAPGRPRADYISKLLNKKAKKGVVEPKEIDADETAAELKVETWPASVREQWASFHKAYREEKKAREPQTQPAAQPAGKTAKSS